MIKKARRYFNTSGPNLPDEHYTLKREKLIEKGKKQLAYYSKSIDVKEGVYLVFVPNTVTLPGIKEQVETIDNTEIRTYIVLYDEEKDF